MEAETGQDVSLSALCNACNRNAGRAGNWVKVPYPWLTAPGAALCGLSLCLLY